jgi:hypothetical protein
MSSDRLSPQSAAPLTFVKAWNRREMAVIAMRYRLVAEGHSRLAVLGGAAA